MSEYITEWVARPLDDGCVREKVVRCRDCTYKRNTWNGKRPSFIPDGFFCAYWGGHELWKPDGFCAWGERRVDV